MSVHEPIPNTSTEVAAVRLRPAELPPSPVGLRRDESARQDSATVDPVIELSVVMPCLNERLTVGSCVRSAVESLRAAGIAGEVIVADNGSTDGSQEIAAAAGARVVPVEAKGYGNALIGGIVAARGAYVLMADADSSYDFEHIPRFVEQLRTGQDLVMGNRFRGGIERGAMPPLHRYLGNPVLTGLGRLFFKSPCGDFHCGMRAFRRDSFLKMDIRSTGMEFASEMVVKASLLGMKVSEAPTTLKPDGRDRRPHLRTWRDGWRHLRFLLMYSPRWLFLYPGMALILAGAAASAWLLPGPRVVGGIEFDIHTLLYAFVAVLLGFQLVAFAVFTKVFAISEGLLPEDPRMARIFRYVKLETGLVAGGLLMLLGIAGSILAVAGWAKLGFGNLDPQHMLRVVMPSVFALTLGVQISFSSFFLSILGLRRRR
ncbi:MAG TPA: glycosyltransferase family 2 protein [Terracidiphilus sp.]|nr:glycosyltransferase family 2 protein [Terracidiphilus sp.]